MTVSEKLQLIKTLSNLSQEKLAQKFKVSFATLNSWINGRSVPHRKAQELIDELYRSYTGQKIIPEHILKAKKEILLKKSKEIENVLGKIMKYPDLYDQFMLLLTYHTNSIEGSTLNENETGDVLFRNKVLANKSLVEQLEVKNHQAALQYLLKYLVEGGSIDEDFVLKLHAILMNGIRDDAGLYRRHGVRIVGVNLPTANYLKVPDLMIKLMNEIKKAMDDGLKKIAKVHAEFEKIHPFSDGNGRIGRLLIVAMLFKLNLPPAIIRQENKQFYYSYLNKAQVAGDSSLLEDFLCDAILEGFTIIERK